MALQTYLADLLRRSPDLVVCQPEIQAAFELLRGCFRSGGKLLICGNGGSAADGEHIVGELMKGFLSRRPVPVEFQERLVEAFPADGAYMAGRLQGALPAISLASQVSLLTAFANDVVPDLIFAQQVYGYGRPGDVLLAISTSGKSKNVLYALQVARVLDLQAISLTGETGGAMAEFSTVAISVPARTTAEIQELHQRVYHALCAMLEEEFFPS